MKTAKLGVSFAAAVLGMVSLLGDAKAELQTNTHGAAFVAYDAGNANDIDYLPWGVRTLASSSRRVIASVVFHPEAAYYQYVTVSGSNYSGQTTDYTVYTHDHDGNLRYSSWHETSEESFNDGVIMETGSEDDDVFVSVMATLPASGNGVLRGVTVYPWHW